jgi:hypothetical protein
MPPLTVDSLVIYEVMVCCGAAGVHEGHVLPVVIVTGGSVNVETEG